MKILDQVKKWIQLQPYHLDDCVVLEHCPQVLYACSSNVHVQGWFPRYTHFLAVLTSLTHSDNLMN